MIGDEFVERAEFQFRRVRPSRKILRLPVEGARVVCSDKVRGLSTLKTRTKEQTDAMRPHLKTLILCTLAYALVFQTPYASAQRRTQPMSKTNTAARSLQKLLEDE